MEQTLSKQKLCWTATTQGQFTCGYAKTEKLCYMTLREDFKKDQAFSDCLLNGIFDSYVL